MKDFSKEVVVVNIIILVSHDTRKAESLITINIVI